MEFEDIQVIWKSQEEQPAFAIDPDVLKTRLEENDIRLERLYTFEEWFYIAITSGLGVAIISEPILDRHEYYQLPIGAGFLAVALFLILNRNRRKKKDVGFELSILGTVELSISRLVEYVSWVKRTMTYFWTVTVITTITSFALDYDSKPIWIWPLFICACVFAYFAVRKQIRCQQRSIKNLQSLREKLERE